MNLFSAVFTGLAVWSSPTSVPANADGNATQIAMVEAVPNYEVTALSQADVDIYLQVMRASADHIQHVSMPGAAAAPATPGTYDEAVAEQQGVRPRYDAIKTVVQAQLDPAVASETPFRAADDALLAPHASEIQALQKQVNGFIYGQ